jgi:hypothetical protein
MKAIENSLQTASAEAVLPADPQQCDPVEVEVFAINDEFDHDMDWEQLAREAHADFKAGNLNFVSMHADPAQARAALRKYLDDILEEVLNGIVASPGADAARR